MWYSGWVSKIIGSPNTQVLNKSINALKSDFHLKDTKFNTIFYVFEGKVKYKENKEIFWFSIMQLYFLNVLSAFFHTKC